LEKKYNADGFEDLSSEDRERIRSHVHQNTDDETAKAIFDGAIPGPEEKQNENPPPQTGPPEVDHFADWHKKPEPETQNSHSQTSSGSVRLNNIPPFIQSCIRIARELYANPRVQLSLILIVSLILGVIIGRLINAEPPPIVI